MTTKNTKKRNTRGSGTLLEKGIFATAIGVAFLLGPWLFSAAPGIHDIEAGLRLPGWLGLGVGLILLGLHVRAQRKTGA